MGATRTMRFEPFTLASLYLVNPRMMERLIIYWL